MEVAIIEEVWRNNPKFRGGSILETDHGKVLQKMAEPVRKLPVIDLGCGNKGASEIFKDYKGVDLPGFDVYESPLNFIRPYQVVLMNAFLDVMENPIGVLDRVLPYCSNYVLIHRQELTAGETSITQEDAYGGWTWHSKINYTDFMRSVISFRILDYQKLNFDNWENGGRSILMQRLCSKK